MLNYISNGKTRTKPMSVDSEAMALQFYQITKNAINMIIFDI